MHGSTCRIIVMEKCLFDKWYYDGADCSRFYISLFEAFINADFSNRVKIANAFTDQFRGSRFLSEVGIILSDNQTQK
jgi:hypothetical protein